MSNLYIGSKFFRFTEEDEAPEIIRLTLIDESANKVEYIDNSMRKKSMAYSDLMENYKYLNPDGLMMFSIVNNDEQVPDVIVSLQKLDNITDNIPHVVCRQGIYDFFTNLLRKTDGIMYIGISVSKDTCPSNIDFPSVLMCNSVKYNRPVSVYLDDSLDDILRLFRHKKYDDALNVFHQAYENSVQNRGYIVSGFCSSLRELLVENNFMYDFRKCFGIYELPFAIEENASESLSEQNTRFLENELKVNIMETYVIEYTREINLDSIRRDYILATSAANEKYKVFIVGYDTADGEYVKRV